MPIPVQCACGRSYRVKDELAGRRARCPGCKQVVMVPPLAPPDDVAMEVVFDDPPPRPAPLPAPAAPPRQSLRPAPGEAVRPAPLRPAPRYEDDSEDDSEPEDRPRKRKKKRRVRRSRGPMFVIAPEIITGLLMMIGAVVWLVLGLQAGYFYFYPPILFILGIGAIIRGFTGGD